MCVCVFKIFIAESKHLYLKIESIQFRQILRAYVLALADTRHYFFRFECSTMCTTRLVGTITFVKQDYIHEWC